ncbi:hypothetical protein ABG067_006326 [Albugo candida]
MQDDRAFVSWKHSRGHFPCALATFGCQEPQVQVGKLVYVNPPRADERIVDENSVQGGIALVIRGGCSFIEKARRVQEAGAVAMILANNDRENIWETFPMCSKQPEATEDINIMIPCVMMSLSTVRELLERFPPTKSTGMLTIEIIGDAKAMYHCQSIKPQDADFVHKEGDESMRCLLDPEKEIAWEESSSEPDQGPVFTFVQWATEAQMYRIFYGPIADFCALREGECLEGSFVVADPILADIDVMKNENELRDAIVLVQRGKCTFPEKLERLQRCGALAVIIGNDDGSNRDATFMISVDKIPVNHLHIPLVMVSLSVFGLLLQEKPHTIRILCLSKETTAAILDSKQERFSLLEIPKPIDTSKDCLFRAAREGDIDKCQEILLCRSPGTHDQITGKDVYHMTALHHACIGGHDQVAKALLAAGARIDAIDLNKHLPVHLASLSGSIKCLELLVQAQNNSDPGGSQRLLCRQNIGGATPLHYASTSGNTQCLECLLTAGDTGPLEKDSTDYSFCGVNVQDKNGCTPLHITCMSANVACSTHLIKANTQLDIYDRQDRNAFEIVCSLVDDPQYSSSALQIAEMLIKAGTKVQKKKEKTSILDIIRSKPHKQELIVAYLCREVGDKDGQLVKLQRDMDKMCDMCVGLQRELQQMSQQFDEKRLSHESASAKQQIEIDTLKQSITKLERSVSLRSNTCRNTFKCTDNLTSSFEEWSDQELAQEAALERDFGKKHARENRFSCAVESFRKSLLYFPLPGVRELLKEAEESCVYEEMI